MKIIDGIEIPETIKEASTMNYEALKKACDVFNKSNLSAEEVQQKWEDQWWRGFDCCLDTVISIIRDKQFFEDPEMAKDFIADLLDEIDIYKKDG